jgi:hypothetical protein
MKFITVIIHYISLLTLSILLLSCGGASNGGSADSSVTTAGVATDSSANSFVIGGTQEGNTEIGAIISLLTTNYKNWEG